MSRSASFPKVEMLNLATQRETAMSQHPDNHTVLKEFKDAVNMSATELESWLKTEESLSVGIKNEGAEESTGHQSGRRIVELLRQSDYAEDDYAHMRRVISYVHRHSAQKPSSDIEHSRWRYSLKNWGHDPIKD
jgi:iron-sulfur cluster repair protein YtfE (RIC family)